MVSSQLLLTIILTTTILNRLLATITTTKYGGTNIFCVPTPGWGNRNWRTIEDLIRGELKVLSEFYYSFMAGNVLFAFKFSNNKAEGKDITTTHLRFKVLESVIKFFIEKIKIILHSLLAVLITPCSFVKIFAIVKEITRAEQILLFLRPKGVAVPQDLAPFINVLFPPPPSKSEYPRYYDDVYYFIDALVEEGLIKMYDPDYRISARILMMEGIIGRPIYARITKEGMKHVSDETHSISIDVKGEGNTIIAGSNGVNNNNNGDGNNITTTNSPVKEKGTKRNPAKQFKLWIGAASLLISTIVFTVQKIFPPDTHHENKTEIPVVIKNLQDSTFVKKGARNPVTIKSTY